MDDEFGHPGRPVAWRAEIEVADGLVPRSGGPGSGNHQMLGAVMPQLTQDLLTHGRDTVDNGCRRDEFVHLPLLIGGQRRTPRGRGH
jgi:hypothetical protein